jgi:hypothetical protein
VLLAFAAAADCFLACSRHQLVTCNMCGCGKFMDAVFTVIAAAWWLVAGFVTAGQARPANNAHVAKKEWRNAVVLLSWITSGLFGLLFFIHMGRIGVSCCRKRRKNAEPDMEKAGLRHPERPPSAAVELGKEVASRPYMMGRFGNKQQQNGLDTNLSGPNI